VLAVASFWQFYLKEVWWPATAINLTTEVTAKEAGLSAAAVAAARNLEAIEVVITANNPSSSTVYLCSNLWTAWGVTVSAREVGGDKSEDWLKGVTDLINEKKPLVSGRHYNSDQKTLISAGSAFRDAYLRAKERLSSTFVFYVPQGLYDLVKVYVYLPTTSRENPARPGQPALGVNYGLNSDRSDFVIASVYRVKSDGTHEELLDSKRVLRESDVAYYGWQSADSTVELSLLESEPSTIRGASPPLGVGVRVTPP
jgi:hypothetical protein